VLLVASEGFLAGANFGYLSCTIPSVGDESVFQHGMALGKVAARPK
jgi:hypothetical protein